jgi:hypothetical protein
MLFRSVKNQRNPSKDLQIPVLFFLAANVLPHPNPPSPHKRYGKATICREVVG